MEHVAKPTELLALHSVAAELFETLRRWFDVPASFALDLSDVDAAVAQMSDPVAIAALAMRKLQGLRLLAQPGVRTSTDVVVTIVQDLDRALLQAPSSRLKRDASTADWDAELASLLEGPDGAAPPAGEEPGDGAGDADGSGEDEDTDPEVTRFRELHGALHQAARAVVEASEGRIRTFE